MGHHISDQLLEEIEDFVGKLHELMAVCGDTDCIESGKHIMHSVLHQCFGIPLAYGMFDGLGPEPSHDSGPGLMIDGLGPAPLDHEFNDGPIYDLFELSPDAVVCADGRRLSGYIMRELEYIRHQHSMPDGPEPTPYRRKIKKKSETKNSLSNLLSKLEHLKLNN